MDEKEVKPEDDSPDALENEASDSGSSTVTTDSGKSKSESRPPKDKRRFSFGNKYLVVFIALLLVAGGVVFAALKVSKKTDKPTTQAQSLTDQQLSALKGSTTVVGDPQRTLDIQSNSVFEGAVLLRKNLDVAGTLKVGGPLSLPSVTVGGKSNFGRVSINGTLSVAGNSTLQGAVNIQKNLTVNGNGSFDSLSASQLTINTLQLTGNLSVGRHIAINGSLPGKSNGAALGSGGTASVNGTDTAGTVTLNTGTGPSSGCLTTISFTNAFSAKPHVIISASNSRSAALRYYTNRSTTNFSICTTSTLSSSTTYLFDYFIVD